MKNFLLSLVFVSGLFSAQNGKVGINTETPQATLEIVGQPNDNSKLDGVIAPRLTGDQLRGKVYTAAQTGAVVYITSPATSLTGQVINVKSSGYYYFDGTRWAASTGNDWATTGNAGTNPTTNFIGTTDNADVVFKRGGIAAGWLNDVERNTTFGVNTIIPSSDQIFDNTAFGHSLLMNIQEGAAGNTTMGTRNLISLINGQSNLALGNYLMPNLIDGNGNIAIGESVLPDLISGQNNLMLGSSTGYRLIKGSQNIGIAMAGKPFPIQDGDYQFVIGDYIFGQSNYTLIPPSDSNNPDPLGIRTDAKIGIATRLPNSTLDVQGSFATNFNSGSQVVGTHYLGEKERTFLTRGHGGILAPDAKTCNGREYVIIYGSGAGSKIVTEIIIGGLPVTNFPLNSTVGNRGITIQSDGTSWYATNIF